MKKALCLASALVLLVGMNTQSAFCEDQDSSANSKTEAREPVGDSTASGSASAGSDRDTAAKESDSAKTAQAADEDEDASGSGDSVKPAAATPAKPAAATPAKPAAKKKGTAQAPPMAMKALSFVSGVVVGTPIAIVREIAQETKIATRDLLGDTDNWFLIAPAGAALGFPAGIVSGGLQGLFFGVKNAWEGSMDEPFSAEAFSLGELE